MLGSSLAHFLLFVLSVLTLFFGVVIALDIAWGNRSLKKLRCLPPWPGAGGASAAGSGADDEDLEEQGGWLAAAPRVSVVLAARNEERNLEVALRSVLAQDYGAAGAYEVVVVNDRSTDRTGAILAELALADCRLRVLHVAELPSHWLGKNYALHYGAQRAAGEVLLFTDADVVMEGSALGRALRYLLARRLDHLAIFPQIDLPGMILNWLTSAFGLFFVSYIRPWKAADPASSKYLGIGAFNLIRRRTYMAIGTHRAIAMRPDDDLKLGKLVKKHGFRQEALLGQGMLAVEWYASVAEMVQGLMKNTFAGIDYRLSMVVGASAAGLLMNVWPFVALVATSGLIQLINALLVLLLILVYVDTARFYGMRQWSAIGLPLAALVFLYILWRSTLTTIRNRGITWRDTWYPLDELKANKV